MVVSPYQNEGQNWDMKIASRSLENVAQFKYLGTRVTRQNLIQGEMKRRLHFGNACYHSVQNLLSSRLLSKNVEIGTYKMTILPVILYVCDTLSLTVGEEHKLRLFENRFCEKNIWAKEESSYGRVENAS
jgi:hypothetical protein